jgi:hypothetical protein
VKKREVKVIRSSTPGIKAWFETFVYELSFFPATNNSIPEASEVLLSVQAIFSKDVDPDSFDPVLMWAKSYVPTQPAGEIPPLTRIVLGFPGDNTKVNPATVSNAPYGQLELLSLGTEWSVGAYTWMKDPSMPQHMTRELVGKRAQ